jgi:hypothetical protein
MRATVKSVAAMMDPAIKTALAFCVLLAGVCAAFLFRPDHSLPALPEAESKEQLLLRYRVHPPAADVRPSGVGRADSQLRASCGAISGVRPATIVTPLDRRELPPSLPPEHPVSAPAASSRWGVPQRMLPPIASPADETTRTHTIVDGDTLAALAERYLGSASRADEIYRANRDVLSGPGLLPIGVQLKVPPRRDSRASQGWTTPAR